MRRCCPQANRCRRRIACRRQTNSASSSERDDRLSLAQHSQRHAKADVAHTSFARTAALSAPGAGGSGPARERTLCDCAAPTGGRTQLGIGSASVDRAAEGFASLFARRYLTWDSRDPEAHRLALAPFVGSWMEPEAGLRPPESGEQQVQWTQVVQAARSRIKRAAVHRRRANRHGGSAVSDRRRRLRGRRRAGAGGLSGLVGAPASTPARSPGAPARKSKIRRCETSWFARSAQLPGARRIGARRRSGRGRSRVAARADARASVARRASIGPSSGRAVLAVVRARDERGTQYTLAYELDVGSAPGAGRYPRSRRTPSS